MKKNKKSENKSNIQLGSNIHIYGKKNKPIRCETDSKGFATPKNRKRAELVLDTSEGFIPLWKKGLNLRWRFSPTIYNFFQNSEELMSPEEAIDKIRNIFSKGILEWGDAAPIKFSERNDAWDFEIVVKNDDCSYGGCVLASAFFPDSGRHQLTIYPKLFKENEQEQIETIAHEIGHIFGLRHFFAKLKETAFPSVNFGQQNPFTIMNYGHKSKMTPDDKNDLKALYKKVWSGELLGINGTKIVTFRPYHYSE